MMLRLALVALLLEGLVNKVEIAVFNHFTKALVW